MRPEPTTTAATPAARVRKPRLLMLSQTLPYPPDSGVAIRTFNVLKLLAESYDVTALCFYRWKQGAAVRDVQGSVAALQQFGRVLAFPIPQEHNRVRLLWDHLRSLLLGRVYTEMAYESAEFRRALEGELAGAPFDVIHVDSLDLSGYLTACAGTPVVCVHHNVESELLRRRAGVEPSAVRRWYVSRQAGLMAKAESVWCTRVDMNVVVSEPDRATLARLVPGSRCVVVPNGVDVESFRPASGEPAGIVFVGGTTWFPNLDALAHFSASILPAIRTRLPDVRVTWVGRATADEQQRYRAEHGITLTGYVDDIRPFVHDAACYVVPLRVGGGTRLKILDAWAMGKAVVSTSVGCEGLDARDGENILVRDDPAGFAGAVERVLTDRALRDRLGAGARRAAEETYSWRVIGRAMQSAYADLTGSRPGRA